MIKRLFAALLLSFGLISGAGAVGQKPFNGFGLTDGTWLNALSGGQNYTYQTIVPTNPGAVQLSPGIALFSLVNAPSGGGVQLPVCLPGMFTTLSNVSSNPVSVFPSSEVNPATGTTDTIGGQASANLSTQSASLFLCSQAGEWTANASGGGGGGSSLGFINIQTYGAIGDGNSHRLSSIYPTLTAAQAVYPFVSDLTQEVDWAATQQAINVSTAGNFANVYCPAVPANGAYLLSNPIFIDAADNTRNQGYTAWASGTTYAKGATVQYNGMPWISEGSGNVGNPPTSASGYPANLSIGGDPLPFGTVAISNGSPAVVTYYQEGAVSNHQLKAGQQIIFYAQTWTDQTITSPALPTGINAGQVYYVISAGLTSTTFEISATPGGTAINTSSAGSGVFTIGTQVWSLNPNGGPNFGNRSNFVGDPGQPSSNGCRFEAFALNEAAFVVGPNNGNYIANINILGGSNVDNGPVGTYRCNAPQGGNLSGTMVGLVGIGNVDNGAGTSRTEYVNIGIDGFAFNWRSNLFGGGTLGDSNTWWKPQIGDGCVGLSVNSEENFINGAYDGAVNNNTTALQADLGTGFNVSGGNYSTFSSSLNQYTMSGVTVTNVSNQYYLTATLNSSATGNFPDHALNHPMCGLNLQCVDLEYSVVTSKFGIVPWHLIGFNPYTQQIQLQINSDYVSPYLNAGLGTPFINDVQGQTTLYGGEVATTFDGGGLTIKNVHVENDSVPTTMALSAVRFGTNEPQTLENILLNWQPSNGDFVCCNQSVSPEAAVQFYLQQTIPFINAGNAMNINGMSGGGNVLSGERVLVEGGNTFNFHGDSGGLLFNFGQNGGGTGCGPHTFTNCYDSRGSLAYGVGYYDNGYSQLQAYFDAINNNFNNPDNSNTQNADMWRAIHWGTGPFWGVRPAPYSMPCITPSQSSALSSPTFTNNTSSLQYIDINSGGSSYQVGDVLTLVGGTFSTAAQVTVGSVNGSGAITSLTGPFGTSTSTAGSYSVEASSFTVTGGHGSSATFNNPLFDVHPSIPYPFLWGGQIYSVCDWNNGTASPTNYSVRSNNLGYSYFVSFTTSNVPNLSWSSSIGSRQIYMNFEALQLMFPGVVATFNPSGGTGCNSSAAETFIITGVHPVAGYVDIVNAAQDGSPSYANWNSATATGVCTGTNITFAGTNLVTPFAGSQSNSTVASPAAAASTSAFQMQGLAGSITPISTGNVKITLSGTVTSTATSSGVGVQYQISYGTGGAPSNGASLTGTQVGTVQQYLNPTTVVAADVQVPFSQTAVISGLTVGTTYWIDLAAKAVSAANDTPLANVNVSAIEN